MKILLICNKSPWPPREGGPIAMNAMVEGLLDAGHSVKVIAINSYKYNVSADDIPVEYRKRTSIELVFVDLHINPLHAFLNLFSSESYHVKRFINDQLSDTIERVLKSDVFDIIQFETLFVTPYLALIRKYSKASVFLRAHNVEFLIWKRLYSSENNPLKKMYLGHLFRTLKKYESDIITKVDGIIAISQKDAEFFSSLIKRDKIISIPFGVTKTTIDKALNTLPDTPGNSIFHLGSMNWMPNVQGMEWFIKAVWPLLKTRIPGLTLHLAGREMPQWLHSIADEQIVVDGEVPDALAYMKRYRIMIVPLFSGSGIRIKIIEGMLASCAVITTTIGAEGIDYVDGKHLLIANSQEEFITAVEKIYHNPLLTESIGKEATDLILKQHDNRMLIELLESFYSQISK